MANVRGKATAFLIFAQVVFVVMFGLFVEYEASAGARSFNQTGGPNYELEKYYPMFQDIQIMMFIGFGFLMTFLAQNGFGAVGFNFLLTCYVIEWATLVNGWFKMIGHADGKIHIDIESFMEADFAVAAVLITYGAVIGKVSPVQLIVLTTIEVVTYNISMYVGVTVLKAIDVGGSIFIHAFGAYFGLAIARVIYKKSQTESPKEKSVYNSDIFAIIGTLFLWFFWPSFNSAPASENERHRAVLNTILSLSACTVTTFAISAVVDKKNKINMTHVQNATLAGGVMIGASADLIVRPFGALLVGMAAATISTLGYKFLQPLLCDKLKVHDTCGVHNLHGMPGVFGGITSAIVCAIATREVYKGSYDVLFPEPLTRTSQQQGGYQIAALAATLGIALVSGALTGFLLKLLPGVFDAIEDDDYFDDAVFWDAVEWQEDGDPVELMDAEEEVGSSSKKADEATDAEP